MEGICVALVFCPRADDQAFGSEVRIKCHLQTHFVYNLEYRAGQLDRRGQYWRSQLLALQGWRGKQRPFRRA